MEKRVLVISLALALVIVVGFATVTGQGTAGDGIVIGEAGEVVFNPNNFNGLLKKVYFNNAYASTPVVIATVVTENHGDNNGLIPVINEVTPTYFWINLCRDAGEVTCSATTYQETVHYFVFDVDKAQNYDWIDVGTINIKPDGGSNTVNWGVTFSNTPYVFATANTYSQGGDISATVWVDAISTTGTTKFIGCTHQGTSDTCDTNTLSEKFGYVVIDPVAAKINGFQSGSKDISNSAWTPISFSSSYTDPALMVLQNDDDGGQDPQYPWARSLTTTGADIRYCEQDAAGDCDGHTSEWTMWFAVEKGDITVSGPTFTEPVQIWSAYPLPAPPYFGNLTLPNPTLYLYQSVRNAPYPDWPDALTLLAEAGNKTNKLNTLLVIRNWGNSTDRRESELRFDSGAWNSSNASDFSYMQAAIYTKGTDQILRLKPGPFVKNISVLGQLRVLNTNGAFITQIVANKSNVASLAFVRTDTRDSGNETASIYRPANSRDLRVYMVGSGPAMTFKGGTGETAGNVGIGTTDPKSTLQVNGYIQLNYSYSSPPQPDHNCDATYETGRMFYDTSTDTLWICQGTNGWKAH